MFTVSISILCENYSKLRSVTKKFLFVSYKVTFSDDTLNFLLQLRDVTARDQRFDWSIHVTWESSPERVYKAEQFLGLVTCENRLLK